MSQPSEHPATPVKPSGVDVKVDLIINLGVICALLVIVMTIAAWAWVGLLEMGFYEDQIVDPEVIARIELERREAARLHPEAPVPVGGHFQIDIDDAIQLYVQQQEEAAFDRDLSFRSASP